MDTTNQTSTAIRTQNRLVLGTAVQIGIDILSELQQTGGLGPDEVKGEPFTTDGVRQLLTMALSKDLKNRGTL